MGRFAQGIFEIEEPRQVHRKKETTGSQQLGIYLYENVR